MCRIRRCPTAHGKPWHCQGEALPTTRHLPLAEDVAPSRAEAFYLKWLYLDTPVYEGFKFVESPGAKITSVVLIKFFPCSQIVDAGFQKRSILIKQVNRQKLTPRVVVRGWEEGLRNKKLAAVSDATDILSVVVIVVDSDERWWLRFHGCKPDLL